MDGTDAGDDIGVGHNWPKANNIGLIPAFKVGLLLAWYWQHREEPQSATGWLHLVEQLKPSMQTELYVNKCLTKQRTWKNASNLYPRFPFDIGFPLLIWTHKLVYTAL